MRGFTLLEVVIYIALLSIVIGGTLAATYELLQGQSSAEGHNTVEAEGSFVLGKIEWMMGAATSSSAILYPPSGACSDAANSFKLGVLEGEGTPYELCLAAGAIRMSTTTCGAGSERVTTDNIATTTLTLRVCHLSTSGGTPAGVLASTTIDGVTFSATRYLRQ